MTVLYDEPTPAFWLRLSILANDALAAVRVAQLVPRHPLVTESLLLACRGSEPARDAVLALQTDSLDAFVEPLLSQLREEASPGG